MKILLDVGHPADVHFFKNFIRLMQEKGHQFKITARNRGLVFDLLKACGFDFVDRGTGSSNIIGKILYAPKADLFLYSVAKDFKPDLFLSFGSMYAAHASKLYGKPHITFDDTEHSTEQYMLYAPFTDAICTPSCFEKDLGKKQVRFNGYMELCYLHPNYFSPDPQVMEEIGLSQSDRFFVLRFVSWDASHDVKQKGLDLAGKSKLISELKKYGRVFISSEKPLTPELEPYRLSLSPEKIHHLLYYATIYIGEGGTMASEAAVLGTPSVFVNSLSLGYLNEQEHKYGLTVNVHDSKHLFDKITPLLERKGLKKEWAKKREAMLKDKIDVTKWMVDFFENYRR